MGELKSVLKPAFYVLELVDRQCVNNLGVAILSLNDDFFTIGLQEHVHHTGSIALEEHLLLVLDDEVSGQ